ncbi:hypothetical protein EDD22DRAFT_1016060 [Suillus occidentalis]|nr:hypothetical protein EDD22DRAFT_1016060 [Suillus occidentalis]
MQHSRALAGLCNPGRFYKQGARSYSTNSPFASFISDVKVPAASTEQTRRSAPRLSSLGDIEIPSIVPSSTTSLFAARIAQRQKRQLAEAAPKDIEAKAANTPKPTPPPTRSLLSRRSQRLPKVEERPSDDASSNPQTAAHTRPQERPSNYESSNPQTTAHPRLRRALPAETRSAPAEMRTDHQREGPKAPKPSRVVEPTSPVEDLDEADTSAPPVLHVSFNNTDLSQLFSSPALIPYVARPSIAQSRIDSRVQLLKERAGDYSRYLSGDIESTALTQGSVNYAKLILGRRREVGLKPRRAAIEVIHQAELSSASGM